MSKKAEKAWELCVCESYVQPLEWEVGSASKEEGKGMTIDHTALGIDMHLLWWWNEIMLLSA